MSALEEGAYGGRVTRNGFARRALKDAKRVPSAKPMSLTGRPLEIALDFPRIGGIGWGLGAVELGKNGVSEAPGEQRGN